MSEQQGGGGFDDEGRLVDDVQAEDDPVAASMVAAAEEAVRRAWPPSAGPSTERTYDIETAAEVAGVSTRTLRRYLRDDKLPGAVKDATTKGWRIPHAALDVAGLLDEPRAGTRRADPTPSAPEPPAGVLVPVDAWQRMMEQLGHLHEAGQELAEARERAGRAEEREAFMRERLDEERRRREEAEATLRQAIETPSSVRPLTDQPLDRPRRRWPWRRP